VGKKKVTGQGVGPVTQGPRSRHGKVEHQDGKEQDTVCCIFCLQDNTLEQVSVTENGNQ
jgi:hypothetical protein